MEANKKPNEDRIKDKNLSEMSFISKFHKIFLSDAENKQSSEKSTTQDTFLHQKKSSFSKAAMNNNKTDFIIINQPLYEIQQNTLMTLNTEKLYFLLYTNPTYMNQIVSAIVNNKDEISISFLFRLLSPLINNILYSSFPILIIILYKAISVNEKILLLKILFNNVNTQNIINICISNNTSPLIINLFQQISTNEEVDVLYKSLLPLFNLIIYDKNGILVLVNFLSLAERVNIKYSLQVITLFFNIIALNSVSFPFLKSFIIKMKDEADIKNRLINSIQIQISPLMNHSSGHEIIILLISVWGFSSCKLIIDFILSNISKLSCGRFSSLIIRYLIDAKKDDNVSLFDIYLRTSYIN